MEKIKDPVLDINQLLQMEYEMKKEMHYDEQKEIIEEYHFLTDSKEDLENQWEEYLHHFDVDEYMSNDDDNDDEEFDNNNDNDKLGRQ